MACRSAEIADALADDLNAQSFSVAFTAVRRFRPRWELPELEALRVSVAPASRESSFLTRGSDRHMHAIAVTFQQLVGGDDDDAREADIDAKAELVEEVADHMARLSVVAGGVTCPVAEPVKIDPVCALDELDERLLFVSVVTATFREVRAA